MCRCQAKGPSGNNKERESKHEDTGYQRGKLVAEVSADRYGGGAGAREGQLRADWDRRGDHPQGGGAEDLLRGALPDPHPGTEGAGEAADRGGGPRDRQRAGDRRDRPADRARRRVVH